MKKSLIVALSMTTLLAACGEEKTEEKGATHIEGNTGKVEKTEKVETKNSDKKDVTEKTEKVVKEKATDKQASGTDIMSPEFHKMYMFADHRFEIDKIKFGMTREAVEAIYGESSGEGKDLYGPKTSALYDVYAVNYDSQNKVRQIVINPNKKITKAEFLKVYSNPTEEKDYPSNTLEYNDNNENGYKIRAAFDKNDTLIGIAQINDGKGMIESNANPSQQNNDIQASFSNAIYQYAEDNDLAATSNYLSHGGGITTDLFVNTEDGLLLAQSMMNPGEKVHDIKVVAGAVVYKAKDGTTGEHEAAIEVPTAAGIGGLIDSSSNTVVYLLSDQGKVYEYQTKGGKEVTKFFSRYSESWGFDTSNMPLLKATTNKEINKIASQVMSGKQIEKSSNDNKEKKATSGEYSFIDENGKIDLNDPAFKTYFFYEPHTNDFAGLTKGMPVDEVESMYGAIETGKGHDLHQGGLDRVGDISFFNKGGKFDFYTITPETKMTKEEFIKVFGEPTEIKDHHMYGEILIYNSKKNNGFQVVVSFGSGDELTLVNMPENDL